jgi:hypothetical protein
MSFAEQIMQLNYFQIGQIFVEIKNLVTTSNLNIQIIV